MELKELNLLSNIELKAQYKNLIIVESLCNDKTELFEIAQEKRIIKEIILNRAINEKYN